MSKRDVVVFSHRRSGTHLTIDTIRNNFSSYKEEPLNIDALRDPKRRPRVRKRLLQRQGSQNLVMKSHSLFELEDHFIDQEARQLAEQAVGDAIVVYVYRDGRDVLASLYYYVRNVRGDLSSLSFSEFLRSPDLLSKRPGFTDLDMVEYWNHHIVSWWDRPDVHYVSFESILTDLEGVVGRLSEVLNQSCPSTIRNVVRQDERPSDRFTLAGRLRDKLYEMYQEHVHGLRLSSVNFRSGRSGSYEQLFSDADLKYFNARAGEAMRLLGYYPEN